MDQSYFDRTVFDRTVTRQWKVEEKELSELLYKKLKGLFLLYAPSEELRKLITADIFLKSNDQAFFQVMNYLFRLLDPVEYKKRFFWPLSDKQSESKFRSSTVEYLKFLNEKHHLQWKNIIIVITGGIRFINFMLEIISFVIQELIRQEKKDESNSNAESSNQESLTIKEMIYRNKTYKDFASQYTLELDKQINVLNDKMQLIKDQIGVISSSCPEIPESQLTDIDFLNEFDDYNRSILHENIIKPKDQIVELKEKLLKITDATKEVFTKHEPKFDKSALRKSLMKVHDMFFLSLDIDKAIDSNSNKINLKVLVSAFLQIRPIIETALSTFDTIPCPNNLADNDLSGLQDELQRLATLATEFQRRLNENIKSQKAWPRLKIDSDLSVSSNGNNNSFFLSKFVSTPPIKADKTDFSHNRLPLLDDVQMKAKESILLAVGSRSVRKQKLNETSIDFNTNCNKTKLFNPIQLLRSIKKPKPMQRQETFLKDSSFRQRHALFRNDLSSNSTELLESSKRSNIIYEKNLAPQAIRPRNTLTPVHSPISSLASNDFACIARKQLVDASDGSPLLYAKKPTAVKKVQDASWNLHDVSTSPSGRLETLISFDAMNGNAKESDSKKALLEKPENLLNLNRSNNEIPASIVQIEEINFRQVHLDCDEDAIFNTSDGILKDISI